MSSQTADDRPARIPRQRRTSPEAAFETAAVLRLLMWKPWLIAGRDDDAIGAVRRNLAAIRDAVGKLGWVLIAERDFVRLRKSPPTRRDAWAAHGPKPLTCVWFFLLVAAAESMPAKVGLGQLVTAAKTAAAEAGLPAPDDQAERYAIHGALKMLDDRRVVENIDGDLDEFLTNSDAPVLLAVHHHRLVHVIANIGTGNPVADPQGWLAQVEREADPARRMRRRLIDDTVVHTVDLDDDEADWMSRRVRGDDGLPLAETFGLHLERRAEGAAFIVPDDAFRLRKELGDLPFPAGGTVAHAALLLCDAASSDGAIDADRPGWRRLAADDIIRLLAGYAAQYGHGRGWGQEYVENLPKLSEEIQKLLTDLALLRVENTTDWWFSPAAGRWERAPAPVPEGPPTAPRRENESAPVQTLFDPDASPDLFGN